MRSLSSERVADLADRLDVPVKIPPRETSTFLTAGSWVLAARILGMLAFALNNVILARMLGPDEFGYFAVASSAAVFAGFVAILGMNRSLLKAVAIGSLPSREWQLQNQLRFSVRILKVSAPTAAVLTSVITLMVLRSLDTGSLIVAAALGFLAITNGAQSLIGDVLRATGEIRLSSFLQGRSGGSLILAIHTLLLLPFLFGSLSLEGALALNVLAFLAVLLPSALHLRNRWLRSNSGGLGSAGRSGMGHGEYLKSSLRFVGIQLIFLIGPQVDLWIAGGLLRPDEVSMFAAATRLMILVAIPLATFQFALQPKIASLYASGHIGRLEEMIRKTATVIALPSMLLLAIILIFPRQILSILFGGAFAGGSVALLWLAGAQLINSLTGLCGTLLSMTGFERDSLRLGGMLLLLKIGFGIPLGIRYGIYGLAAASAVGTALQNIGHVILARRRTGIWSLPRVGHRDLKSFLRDSI